jgi:DNA-binding CsgD family transcriptional regulator/tetratricopeptide (TPR) repeat protein
MRILTWILLFSTSIVYAQQTSWINQGWQALVKDDDVKAIQYFNQALEESIHEKNTYNQANAYLHLGIASYGRSLSTGLHYAQQAHQLFQQVEDSQRLMALEGEGKCLQLFATLKAREGKTTEAITLGHQALTFFHPNSDTTGYRALIHHMLGSLHKKLNHPDSARFYLQQALNDRIQRNDKVYLPTSYNAMADLYLEEGHLTKALASNQEALHLAQQTQNRQAEVSTWLTRVRWAIAAHQPLDSIRIILRQAKKIASTLTDQFFLLRCMETELEVHLNLNQLNEALASSQQIIHLKDSMRDYDKERLTQLLEVQFDVKQTEQKLELIQKENQFRKYTNYSLLAGIGLVLLFASIIIWFYKKVHTQQRDLIKVKQDLLDSNLVQQQLSEQTLRNEIEYRESQLSAITIQMLQKNKLLEEIQDNLNSGDTSITSLNKVIHKNSVQEQEWDDFNKSFERVNKNFYSRIKQQYPDISPNELKICALIKMNLSIKEMAGILNITADSVKTARYRLRKKLNLQTEDNLTEFITQL